MHTMEPRNAGPAIMTFKGIMMGQKNQELFWNFDAISGHNWHKNDNDHHKCYAGKHKVWQARNSFEYTKCVVTLCRISRLRYFNRAVTYSNLFIYFFFILSSQPCWCAPEKKRIMHSLQ